MAATERPKQDEPEQNKKPFNLQETSAFRVKDTVNLDALLSGNQGEELDFESDDNEDRVPPFEEEDSGEAAYLMNRASKIITSNPPTESEHKSIEDKLAMGEEQIKEESSAKTLISKTPRPVPPPLAAPRRSLADTFNKAPSSAKKISPVAPAPAPDFSDDDELLTDEAPPPRKAQPIPPPKPVSGAQQLSPKAGDELLSIEIPPVKTVSRPAISNKPNNFAETVMAPSRVDVVNDSGASSHDVSPEDLNPEEVMASLEKMAAEEPSPAGAGATASLNEEEIQKNLALASKAPAPIPPPPPNVSPGPPSKPVSFADAFAVRSKEDTLKKPDVMDTAAVLAAVDKIVPMKTPTTTKPPMAAAETFIVSPTKDAADDLPPFDPDSVLAEVEKMTPPAAPPKIAPKPKPAEDAMLDDDQILAEISKMGFSGQPAPVEEPPSDTDDKLLLQATKLSGGKSKIKDFAPEKISPSREYPAVKPSAPVPPPVAEGEIFEDDFSELEDDFSALEESSASAGDQNAATLVAPSSAGLRKEAPAEKSSPSQGEAPPPVSMPASPAPQVEDDSDILSKLLKEGGISSDELNALNQSASAGSGRETVTFEPSSKRVPAAGISEHESIAKTLLKEEAGELDEEEEANEQIIDEIISHASTLKEFSERKEEGVSAEYSSKEMTGATMIAPKQEGKKSLVQFLFGLLLLPWGIIKRLFKKIPRPADYDMTYSEVLGYLGIVNIIVAIFLLIVWKYARWL